MHYKKKIFREILILLLTEKKTLIWNPYSFLLCNKHRDLESVLNIIKLFNKIELEKYCLEIIVTSNLRLRKCL